MTKQKDSAEKAIRDIRRATRRQYSAEEKIRIVLEGLRGESSIAELCRKEGINQNLYYRWSKEFLEAGKKRLAGGVHILQMNFAGSGGLGVMAIPWFKQILKVFVCGLERHNGLFLKLL